jgi:hypothetical protein
VQGFFGNEGRQESLPDGAGRWISPAELRVSWRAPVPEFLPGERVSWKCAAQRREGDGAWLTAGDLYVTQRRLIWQPPRWARADRRATVFYPLEDCAWFGRGDRQSMGRATWKRMRLELASGQTVQFTVRRPETAANAIGGRSKLRTRDLGPASD